MLEGNGSLYWDIHELIADCRNCDKPCGEWCLDIVNYQVRDIVERAKRSPEYIGKD